MPIILSEIDQAAGQIQEVFPSVLYRGPLPVALMQVPKLPIIKKLLGSQLARDSSEAIVSGVSASITQARHANSAVVATFAEIASPKQWLAYSAGAVALAAACKTAMTMRAERAHNKRLQRTNSKRAVRFGQHGGGKPRAWNTMWDDLVGKAGSRPNAIIDVDSAQAMSGRHASGFSHAAIERVYRRSEVLLPYHERQRALLIGVEFPVQNEVDEEQLSKDRQHWLKLFGQRKAVLELHRLASSPGERRFWEQEAFARQFGPPTSTPNREAQLSSPEDKSSEGTSLREELPRTPEIQTPSRNRGYGLDPSPRRWFSALSPLLSTVIEGSDEDRRTSPPPAATEGTGTDDSPNNDDDFIGTPVQPPASPMTPEEEPAEYFPVQAQLLRDIVERYPVIPILPSSWQTDFPTFPPTLFAHSPTDNSFISPSRGTPGRARTALTRLCHLSADVRTAFTNNGSLDRRTNPPKHRRPEAHTMARIRAYRNWALTDARRDQGWLDNLLIVGPLEQGAYQPDFGRQMERFDEQSRARVEAMVAAAAPTIWGAARRLPLVFGVVTAGLQLGIVAYDPNANMGTGVNHLIYACEDLSDPEGDVRNALLVSSTVLHAIRERRLDDPTMTPDSPEPMDI